MPARPLDGYKDSDACDRVKRQAARFRVFGYDETGTLIGEITAATARIVWNVRLANSKAEWDRFDGRKGEDLSFGERRGRAEWRNGDIADVDRHKLVISPGAVTLDGPDQSELMDDGRFFDCPVTLGEVRTDPFGRLLVLAGKGKSGSVEEGRLISHYANNDRWYDDIADGPINARVMLPDGRVMEAKPAWVLTAPPDFAPDIPNPVTLYDVALDTAVRAGRLSLPEHPSFTSDIHPILDRAIRAGWTSERARAAHEHWGAHLDMEILSSNSEEAGPARMSVFDVLRNPDATGTEAESQANARFMPALAGDDGDCEDGVPGTWLSLTRTQYQLMKRWAAGDFDPDWAGAPQMRDSVTPEGLDRAALEACTGGAFYPGIEGGWIFRNPEAYAEPFRFDPKKLGPGDVTKRMALPWQADFFECNTHWWPAQRPDEVLPDYVFRRLRQIDQELGNPNLGNEGSDQATREELLRERDSLLARRVSWTRGLPDTDADHAGGNAMVEEWAGLGFVTAVGPDGGRYWSGDIGVQVESEVAGSLELTWPEMFHRLVNIDRYPGFRRTAFAVAHRFLFRTQYSEENYRPFTYSPEAFRERLDRIYNGFVADMDERHWLQDFPRAAVIENLRQKAPMNLTDGAWLQNILAAGPVDEVRARLFGIWADEAGNGESELNHSNVYETLLRSLDVYLPPVSSRAFAELDLLPEAFENPVFQLCVGLFPDEFFPELLGMTVYLEWEATPTMLPVVRMLKAHQIDPQFYSMHAAIDNVTSGHGAMAREAVELYLDRIRSGGGEQAVQQHWRRIWNGYVTWATVGNFGRKLRELLTDRYGADTSARLAKDRMARIVREKARYARTAHGTVQLGEHSLAMLFSEPEMLLDALHQHGWVNPSHPRKSRFVEQLLGFRGPMYKVFSDDEIAALLDWIASLDGQPVPVPKPVPVAQRVFACIKALAPRAVEEPAHRQHTIHAGNEGKITVAELFSNADPATVMKALAGSEYVVPGNPESSPLIARVFRNLMPGVLSNTEVGDFGEWIRTGCPMPDALPEPATVMHALHGPALRMRMLEPVAGPYLPGPVAPSAMLSGTPSPGDGFARRRQFIGAGSVH